MWWAWPSWWLSTSMLTLPSEGVAPKGLQPRLSSSSTGLNWLNWWWLWWCWWWSGSVSTTISMELSLAASAILFMSPEAISSEAESWCSPPQPGDRSSPAGSFGGLQLEYLWFTCWEYDPLCENRFEHFLHSKGFSPVCKRLCSTKWCLCLKALLHSSHWWGLWSIQRKRGKKYLASTLSIFYFYLPVDIQMFKTRFEFYMFKALHFLIY